MLGCRAPQWFSLALSTSDAARASWLVALSVETAALIEMAALIAVRFVFSFLVPALVLIALPFGISDLSEVQAVAAVYQRERVQIRAANRLLARPMIF